MESLNPILLASPVRRSGTTLLQRLLCSAPNTLIYGETCAKELEFMLHFYQTKQLTLMPQKALQDDLIEQVLDGKVNDWIANLMPPTAEHLAAIAKSYFGILAYYRDFAAEQKRPVWGLKMAEWSSSQLQQIERFFPAVKVVYIQRNLADCARSVVRINLVQNETELEQFCQGWQHNIQQLRSNFPKEKLLWVDYQQLLEEPEKVISELEAFTGAKGIDRSVMEKKINTFSNDQRQAEGSEGYLEPAALGDSALAIIQKYS